LPEKLKKFKTRLCKPQNKKMGGFAQLRIFLFYGSSVVKNLM
jgi:hypothetical protein